MSLSGTVTGRERASGHAEQHRWPEMPAAGEHSRRTAPSRAAFWLVAGVFCLLFFAAGAPTPLYGVYQAQLRFSATTLTAVFAIYAFVLLLTLLVFGSVSDYLGRRRVILAALVGERGRVRGVPGRAQRRAAVRCAGAAGRGRRHSHRCARRGADRPATRGQRARPADHRRRPRPGAGSRRARAPARWPSTGRRPPAWCGGCCSAPAWPPPPGYWRCPSPGPGALASWPRCGPGWACRARRAGRSPPRCRA